jgi:hypothetical protein
VDSSLTADHAALLALADHLTGVAGGGQPVEVEAAVFQILERFERHADREASAFVHVAPSVDRRLRRGQARVVEAFLDLLTAVTTGSASPGPAIREQVRLCVDRLRLQVSDEQAAFS